MIKILVPAIIVAIALIFLALFAFPQQEEEYHTHADFKVYLEGEQFNFSQEKFFDEALVSAFVHVHDMDGDVIHQHVPGITLGYFFNSLGMEFNSTCFVTDEGQQFCNSGSKTLKMYVNLQSNQEMGDYEFSDLDKILITFGNEIQDQIQEQMESVTEKSCIQSGKCPEKGPPANESGCTTLGGCVE